MTSTRTSCSPHADGPQRLAVLDPFAVGADQRGVSLVGGWVAGHRVGRAQVGVQRVDDGLPLLGVVLGETFEGVEAAETDGALSEPSCSTALV